MRTGRRMLVLPCLRPPCQAERRKVRQVELASYITVRTMTGDEFVRRIRALARERGTPMRFETRAGKGSHGRLYFGDRFTTVKNRRKEIGQGLLAAMLRQLGLSREDI